MNNYEFCALFAEEHVADRGRVLDYGCGRGEIVKELVSRKVQAFGCDVFYEGGSYKNQVDPELVHQERIREMHDGRIPFESNFFDVVVHNQVFEHVPDLHLAVQEIARVLKPGGLMLGLFPDNTGWREGHCGIPLLHWFPRGSRPRVYYALALRALGFGHHHGTKTRMQWAEEFCEWIDRWTYYRSYSEIRAAFDKHFTPLEHIEAAWFDRRVGRYARVLPSPLKTFVVRKWAGMVVWCAKTSV
jgi:SAM-dependent methyltransferase